MDDEASITHLTEATREKLRQTVAKIERLEEEKKEVAEQIKEIYAEAKAFGFDTKALRQVIKLRKVDRAEREEQDGEQVLGEREQHGGQHDRRQHHRDREALGRRWLRRLGGDQGHAVVARVQSR